MAKSKIWMTDNKTTVEVNVAKDEIFKSISQSDSGFINVGDYIFNVKYIWLVIDKGE